MMTKGTKQMTKCWRNSEVQAPYVEGMNRRCFGSGLGFDKSEERTSTQNVAYSFPAWLLPDPLSSPSTLCLVFSYPLLTSQIWGLCAIHIHFLISHLLPPVLSRTTASISPQPVNSLHLKSHNAQAWKCSAGPSPLVVALGPPHRSVAAP